MIVFHSDLDNTLLYSYKHDIGERKICVERYQERELSFMTTRSYELLEEIREHVLFVPTTTRTEEQYKRITFGENVPEYALVCNGGVLLVNGESETAWYQESLQMIEDCRDELLCAETLLQEDEYVCFEIRNIQKLFLFTKSSRPERTVQKLTEFIEASRVDIFRNGQKVYVVPKVLNKGAALKRFSKRMQCEHTIAAGDSNFDIPMLNAASVAIAPEKLAEDSTLTKEAVIIKKDEQFAEGLLQYLFEHALRI